MNTTENNKLIAEFLGLTLKNGSCYRSTFATEQKVCTVKQLKYNLDWNSLMQVVEKIENTTINGFWDKEQKDTKCEFVFSVKMYFNQCLIDRDFYPQYSGTDDDFLKLYDCRNMTSEKPLTKIQVVYNSCVEFIKWYNKEQANRAIQDSIDLN